MTRRVPIPGLYIRAVVAGTIAVAACVLLMLFFGGTVYWGSMRRMAEIMQPIGPDELDEKCTADQETYLWDNGRGLRAWPVDPTTLEPWRDDVLPTPALLAFRAGLGEEQPVILGDGDTFGGAMLIRRPDAAACQMVVVAWDSQEDLRILFQTRILLLFLIVAVVTLSATALLVLRPLFRSIRALDGASRQVGTPTYPADLRVDRSLDAVVTALDAAHLRILGERAQLEANTRALERHLADIAHDLRTPLAALQLRLEQLSHEQESDVLRGALRDVTSISLLTENLALASQLDAGALPVADEPIDLGAVVDRVADRFQALGGRVGIDVVSVRPDQPVWVQAATVHVEQLLANLVNNAVTSNHPGGHVALVLTTSAERFVVRVEDDGPGIPPSERNAVLKRGVRRRPPSTRPDGAAAGETPGEGLGLSIVVQLAEHLGWSFHFEDPEEGPGVAALLEGPCVAPPASRST